MKPEYHTIYNRCSLFEGEQNIAPFLKQLSSLIEKDKISQTLEASEIPFIVSIIVNPDEYQIKGGYNYAPNIYLKLADEFQGDAKIHAFLMRLTGLPLPKGIDSIFVYFGTTKYTDTSPASATPPQKGAPTGDEDAPMVFTAEEPRYTFDEIILRPEVRHRLERAAAIITHRDLIFNTWGFGRCDKATKSILFLYGPAGTGKTITAHAVASHIGKKIIVSSYAQIESKYVGEGAKNLRLIFDAATEQDAMLFFDEADSFLSNRIAESSSSSDKHYNRMSNEMFQLLENFNGCVVFATNLVSDIDSAFKSRIVDSILFELPDLDGRIALMKRLTPSELVFDTPLTDEDFRAFAAELNGFSGRDIRKSILLTLADAAMLASENQDAFRFTREIYQKGFIEVKETNEQVERESNGGDLIDVAQECVDKTLFNEKLLQIAQHVLYADGCKKPSEVQLLEELSERFRSPVPDWEKTQALSIAEICSGIERLDKKQELMNVACRMATIDKDVPESEITVLQSIHKALGFAPERFENVKQYLVSLIESNTKWENVIRIFDTDTDNERIKN